MDDGKYRVHYAGLVFLCHQLYLETETYTFGHDFFIELTVFHSRSLLVDAYMLADGQLTAQLCDFVFYEVQSVNRIPVGRQYLAFRQHDSRALSILLLLKSHPILL